MRRYELLAGVAALSIAANSPSARQERATDADQQQIEIAVARYMAAADSQKNSLGAYVLDPRLYVRGIPRPGPAPAFKLELHPKVEAASVVAASHGKEHLDALVRILGVNGILVDQGFCTPTVPDLCRLIGNKGIVTFSVAWLRGDVAEVMVSVWTRISRVDRVTGTSSEIPTSYSRIFTLNRTARGWVVSKLQIMT